MNAHKPKEYVGGVYSPITKEWTNNFSANLKELFDEDLNKTCSLEESRVLFEMSRALTNYDTWWKKFSYKMKTENLE